MVTYVVRIPIRPQQHAMYLCNGSCTLPSSHTAESDLLAHLYDGLAIATEETDQQNC